MRIGQSPPHILLLDVDFTATVTQGVTHTVYSISHGYGYTPFTLSNIIFDHSSGSETGIGTAGIGATLTIKAECTSTVFRVTVFDDDNWTDATARLRVSAYIFAEDGV